MGGFAERMGDTLDTLNQLGSAARQGKGDVESMLNHTETLYAQMQRVDKEMAEGGKLAEVNGKKPKVAMFCTGGIRCEKAAIYLEEAGISNVYQLDGGILSYFEECGQAHFEGECFVFDDRRAVNAALKPRVNPCALSDS